MYIYCNMNNTQDCPCKQGKDELLEDTCDDIMTLSDYNMDNCDCGYDEDDSPFPENPMYGNSYVPNQILKTTFLPDVGLKLGTIYPELVRPYMPGQSMAEIEYLRKTNPIKERCNRE